MADMKSIDIVKSVFEHRLRQADMDRILAALSETDRDELVRKMGDLLDRVSALVEVHNRVSDTLSLDVMLPLLMEIVTEALHAERSTLFLSDPETGELYSRVAQGDSIGEIRIPSDKGIAGAVFTSGVSEIIVDAYLDPRFNREVDKKTGFKTRDILCTVIRRQGRAIGVTQVLNKKAGTFDPDDMAVLEALTAQAASALENARLFEKVEKARQEEAQLLEITSSIASELDLDTLLRKIISVATEMLSADRSTLFIYDPKSGQLWSRIAEGLDTKEIRIPSGAGIAGACFTSGEPINIPDAYADNRFNPGVDKKTGYRTRSILCMPVANKDGEKRGVIQVLNKKCGPFGENDEKRLKAFAAQAAIALENAQLFESVAKERNYNESILKSLSNGVLTLDAERKVIKVNDAAVRILSLQSSRAVGLAAAELFPGQKNEWILASLEKVAAGGGTDISVDAELKRSDGAVVSVNATAVPLLGLNGEAVGYMVVLEDITSEKRVKSTMARYMTKEVADRLLEGGDDALGGTAQTASVLFSDIRKFTTISEALGPRDTVTMLNSYFSDMIDVIFRHKGMLDKYIGDAMMAVFGVPFAGERDAENAVRAANEMLSALRRINEQRAMLGIPEIHIGVGVSTGELIAGNIGSLKRMDYTVIGDTVNLASRLEGTTKYYGAEVVFSEFTRARLPEGMRVRELDLIRVKGKNKPVAIFEGLDHHDPESFPKMEQVLSAFSQGLARHRAQDWRGAIEAFEAALAARPDDGPSKLYLERSRLYQAAPPPDGWDGVHVMTTK